jgi:hypothetical protein
LNKHQQLGSVMGSLGIGMARRSRALAKLAAFVTVIFALIGAGGAFAAADAGEVIILRGECSKLTGDQRRVLKPGETVQVGDVVEVSAGAKLKLRMIDGSVVSLGSGSRMTVQAYDVTGDEKRNAKLYLGTGLLHAIVRKVGQPSTFEVTTGVGVAAVRSTDWFVEAEPGNTRISVLDGTVSLAPNAATGSASVLIPPRSVSAVAARRPPTPPRPGTQAEFDRLIDSTNIPLGWCQCAADRGLIRAICEASPDSCHAYCSGSISSFIPDAQQSCAALGAGIVAGRNPR